MDYQIISKGFYSYPQSNEQVTLKQFIFAYKNDKKCLLLRFDNNEETTISGIQFLVLEMDKRGNKIGEQLVKSHDIHCAGGESFSVSEDIFIHDDCTDFKVQIVAADFGDYKYSYKKNNTAVSYDPPKQIELDDSIKKTMGLQKKSVAPKNYKLGGLLLIVTVVVILAAFGFTWLQLGAFVESAAVFTLDNIEYEFSDTADDMSEIVVTNYKGHETNIIIPDVIQGMKVVAIKEEALSNKTITSVVIEGNPAIGDRAFANCTDLKSVSLGSTTTIGMQAFYNCPALESISSESMLTVGSRAFEDCTALSSISFSGTADLTLGEKVFLNCQKLKSVRIDQPVTVANGINFLFANDFSLEEIYLPTLGFTGTDDTLHKMFGKEFADTKTYSLKKLTLGYVSAIGDNFSKNMTALESLTILDLSNTYVGESAFENCYKLASIETPSKFTELGDSAFKNSGITKFDLSGITALGTSVFEGCSALDTDISKLTTDIPDNTFFGCSSLKNVTFSDKVRNIGESAFENCDGILNATVPETVQSIGLSAFRGCTSMKSISVPFMGKSRTASAQFRHFAYIFGNGNAAYSESQVQVPASLKTVKLTGNDITELVDNAFYHCKNVETIEIPDTVVSIGTFAFHNCASLKQLTLPKSSLRTIGNNAFASCTSLTSVYIPVTVTEIGTNILGGDTNLREVTIPYLGASKTDTAHTFAYLFGTRKDTEIPASVVSVVLLDAVTVPDSAFKNASSIQTITLSQGVDSIGASAFEGCAKLVSINLTANLTEIQEKAFYRSGIETIVIPDNIKAIGKQAFAESGLTSVEFKGSLDLIDEKAFQNTQLVSLELPVCSDVKPYAFANNSKLTTLTQKDGATLISENEFNSCAALTEATIAETVTTIGQNSFLGCGSLVKLSLPYVGNRNGDEYGYLAYIFGSGIAVNGNKYVPETLREVALTKATLIPQNAFYGLTSLKRVSLNDDIKTIESNAFDGCTSLNYINIPSGLIDDIESNAFNNCYKLVEIINPSPFTAVAPNPLAVYDSETAYIADSEKFTDENGFEFYKADVTHGGDWYLVDYDHSKTELTLPQTPSGENARGIVRTASKYNIIGHFAEANTAITKIGIAACISSIGDYAFSENASLESILFPEDTCYLREIGSYAFNSCAKLKDAKIPDGTETISDFAFAYDSSLSAVYLPFSLSEANIGESAFIGCPVLYDVYNLTSFDIEQGSDNHGYVAKNALLIHNNKTKKSLYDSVYGDFVFKTNGIDWFLYALNSMMPENLVLGEFESAEGDAYDGLPFQYKVLGGIFNANPAIKSVSVSGAVTVLPENCFAGCTSLTTADLSGASSLKVLADSMFSGCLNLSAVTLPSASVNLTSFGEEVFKNCSSLLALTIPSTVTEIGESAFENCYRLEDINIPENLESISRKTYYNCYRLYNITLPSSLLSIGEQAFYNCYGLSVLTLPENLESISTEAFTGCKHLYGIINLSGLTVVTGTTSNGQVSLYAKEVVQSAGALSVNTLRDGEFYYVSYSLYNADKWYLYSISGETENGLLELADSFEFEGSEINSYTVAELSMTNPDSHIDKIIAPSSIALFSNLWFQNPNNFTGTVYYKGTATTWPSIRSNRSFGDITVLYYAACVHENTQWTLTAAGEISTEINHFVPDRVESDNCDIEVYTIFKCPACGDEYSTTAPGSHDLDENNECKVCHWTLINSANAKTREEITLTDIFQGVSYVAYEDNAVVLKSKCSQKQYYTAIEIKAPEGKSVEADFSYFVDFKSSSSELQVFINDALSQDGIKVTADPVHYSITLNSGNSLKFRINNTSLSANSTANDKVYLYGLKIKTKDID
ncbi:MAG: leucine-rich repeat domain-containing protein [Clostridia bacterium]|nr:leucine-rich repeat domain-containing protein [Clostridia bacterium]